MKFYHKPDEILEYLSRGTAMQHFMVIDRPYVGQPQTNEGDRGKIEVQGVTFRDVYDCIALAFGRSSGLPDSQWQTMEIYELQVSEMDPIAICQNACVLLRERMRDKGMDVPEPKSVERFRQQFMDELQRAEEDN